MLYDLIKAVCLIEVSMLSVINTTTQNRKTDSGYAVFDAIEMAIEYSAGEFYLFLLPSIHILKKTVNKFLAMNIKFNPIGYYQEFIINSIMKNFVYGRVHYPIKELFRF